MSAACLRDAHRRKPLTELRIKDTQSDLITRTKRVPNATRVKPRGGCGINRLMKKAGRLAVPGPELGRGFRLWRLCRRSK
ncbi:hypothetical protein GCM10011410_02200 [Hoyosella rhizosphaerae]|uniref:Uncharacterized protein n=1 Tax=Hoyosella rhizosphaerae TaxID=1755582 RepID=A0A916TZE6_9ACTN|nr:hypothetical protein GCM10011410_02200 [Hoyosella rhizosphaerae]